MKASGSFTLRPFYLEYRFFSSPKRLDRRWGPWRLLFSDYRIFLRRGQIGRHVKLTTDLHLVPRWRSGASDARCAVVEDSGLQECDAVSFREWFRTFRRSCRLHLEQKTVQEEQTVQVKWCDCLHSKMQASRSFETSVPDTQRHIAEDPNLKSWHYLWLSARLWIRTRTLIMRYVMYSYLYNGLRLCCCVSTVVFRRCACA